MRRKKDPICNLCGYTCVLSKGGGWKDLGGLVNADVTGGYHSTAGNGKGALDDCTGYRFSICEFCLDWLFGMFKRPVETYSYNGSENEPWRPAVQRVAEDTWRSMKAEFTKEATKRAKSRARAALGAK